MASQGEGDLLGVTFKYSAGVPAQLLLQDDELREGLIGVTGNAKELGVKDLPRVIDPPMKPPRIKVGGL